MTSTFSKYVDSKTNNNFNIFSINSSVSNLNDQNLKHNLISNNARHQKPIIIENISNTTDSFPRIFNEFDFLEAERDSFSESTDSCFNWLSTMRSSRCALCHADTTEIDNADIGDDKDDYLGTEENEYYDENESEKNVCQQFHKVVQQENINCFNRQLSTIFDNNTSTAPFIKIIVKDNNKKEILKNKTKDIEQMFQSLSFFSFHLNQNVSNFISVYKEQKKIGSNNMPKLFNSLPNSPISKNFTKNNNFKIKDDNFIFYFIIESDGLFNSKISQLLQQNLIIKKCNKKHKICFNKSRKTVNAQIYKIYRNKNLFKRKEKKYLYKILTFKNIILCKAIFSQIDDIFKKKSFYFKKKLFQALSSSASQQLSLFLIDINVDILNNASNKICFNSFESIINNKNIVNLPSPLQKNDSLFTKNNENNSLIFFHQNKRFPLECNHHLSDKVIINFFKNEKT